MHKRTMIMLIGGMLCAVIALTLQGQDQGRAEAPVRVTPPPPKPAPAKVESMSTRFQWDMFEVKCTAEMLAKLDLDEITKDEPSTEQVLERLGTLGEAALLQRYDDTMALPGKAKMSCGARVPVVTSVMKSKAGVVTPAVSYEKIGAILEVDGRWDIASGKPILRANVEQNMADVIASAVTVSSDVTLSTFDERKVERTVVCGSGESVWTMMSFALGITEKDAGRMVRIFRLKATLLED